MQTALHHTTKLAQRLRKFSLAIPLLFLAACGGGGGSGTVVSAPLTGVFLDSAVSGVQYSTKNSAGTTTHSGTTDAQGAYQYEAGDTVTFSIGALVFPTVTATGTITPMTLAGGGTDITANQQATNIARLLQSLDTNGNPNDGIAIPSGAAAAATAVDFNVNTTTFESNPAVTNLVANSGSTTTTLVSEATAQAHFTATMDKRIVGVWRGTGAGGAFSYLLMFADNTFAYGENDLTVQEPLLENGLEVGTYSYDSTTGNITFNVVYDDNTSTGSSSGIGSIGTPSVIDAVLSNGDKTLTIAGGALVLSFVDFGISPISGVWRNTGAGGAFSIMLLADDGAFLYAENDLTVQEPLLENGLEVGTYSYASTTGNITFNVVYDDNTSTGSSSGVGSIGTPSVIDAVLSNGGTTLTAAGGQLVLTREF